MASEGEPRRIGARALGVACLCATALSACGGGGFQRFENAQFSFRYPDDWRHIGHVSFPNAELAGDRAPADNVVGLDRDNWVTVYGDRLDAPVTPRKLAADIPEVTDDYRRALRGSGVRLVSPPTTVRIRSASGMRLSVAFPSAQGTPVTLTITTLYRQRDAWTIACQSDAEHADRVGAGCTQVLDTLEIGRP